VPLAATPAEVTVVVDRLRAAGCVFAEEEAGLLLGAAETQEELEALVGRRVAGEPLEVIVGWVEFGGLRLVVEAGVFVPRRRTELLVHEAAALAWPGAVVVDLCCGVGAIGAALAALVDDLELYAADIDAAAVRCARRNLGGHGRVLQGDLFAPLPLWLRGRVDILAVNAPYVPSEGIALMPAEAREHEPRVALDGGRDGLDVHRRVAAAATTWLRPGGHLLIEAGEAQVSTATELFRSSGLVPRVATSEELEATVVIGTRPA
jgi:release factor glutamine methyltransferase